MKSGQDRVDYVLDTSERAFSILFQILDYNDWKMKCARVEVKGCHDPGKLHSFSFKFTSLLSPVYSDTG